MCVCVCVCNFHTLLIFANLMNGATSHLTSLLCKSSVSKYMIMARSVTNEIIKKIIILISNYHYGVVVYGCMHLKKWNI